MATYHKSPLLAPKHISAAVAPTDPGIISGFTPWISKSLGITAENPYEKERYYVFLLDRN